MSEPFRILCVDGGGIRGIIPALVLDAIERELGQPVARAFDLIAGTSTGGILALGLTLSGPDGAPRYTPAALADLYRKEGGRIFSATLWHRIVSLFGLNGPKYDARGIEAVLADYFGDTRLRDAITPVLVTSYETEVLRDPFFFSSREAQAKPAYDFLAREVARATSAAPTYFPPLKLTARPGDESGHEYYVLVDGGVFANNPAMCGYAEARADEPGRDVLVVSLGTGQHEDRIRYARARRWGLLGWARPILDVVFDGVSDTVDYQLRQVLPPLPDGSARYFRLQCELAEDESAMDDARPANLARLESRAEALIQREHDTIAQISRTLKNEPVMAGG